jgi:hypothetical protein
MLWIRTHLRGMQYMFVIISNLWSQPISGSPNRCTAIWENEMWWSNSFIDADHVQYVLPLVSLPRVFKPIVLQFVSTTQIASTAISMHY